MHDLTAKRTLVKSPPELWSEVSEVERLARHLGAFGEITITKLEPEHTVAWEGESASGTVSIEPSGWGTKVTLRAQLEAAAVEEPAAAVEAPEVEEPEVEEPELPTQEAEAPEVDDVEAPPPDEPEPPRKPGFFARVFGRRRNRRVLADEGVSGEAAEEPRVEEPPAEEPAVAEPPLAQEPLAEEPAVAESALAEEPAVAEPPLAEQPPAEEPAAEALDPEHAQAILDEALEALGSAHHRPFSRG
jgi:hypothetical protein